MFDTMLSCEAKTRNFLSFFYQSNHRFQKCMHTQIEAIYKFLQGSVMVSFPLYIKQIITYDLNLLFDLLLETRLLLWRFQNQKI